jgi:RNA polymerase sigma-70 factor (ECF subfamily)
MDDAAFARFLRQHQGLMARTAASYEANASLRDDLLQDMALALWRAVPTHRGEARLKTFVARIVHNCAVNHVIKHQRRRQRLQGLEADVESPDASPEVHAERDQQGRHLVAAIRSLPLTLQQVVTLKLEGFTHEEIGTVLGISANNVAVRLTRARQALAARLGESA